jgi:hypothetical protein
MGPPDFSRESSLKASINKIVRKLRREPITAGRVSRKKKTSRSKSTTVARIPVRTDVTGQTVFDDRPLRFRSLTLTEADVPALEDASTIEGAFKIRVAKRTGARRDAWSLVERRYTGRGYTAPGKLKTKSLRSSPMTKARSSVPSVWA